MGWANCGEDSKGRPIGYAHDAICDAPGCSAEIHRGLAYACGPMHGEGEFYCEGYFCETHRGNCLPIDDRTSAVCDACYAEARVWAIEHPGDSEELIAHFIDWEGEDWADAGPTPIPAQETPHGDAWQVAERTSTINLICGA